VSFHSAHTFYLRCVVAGAFALFIAMGVAQTAPTFPALTGRVVDQANIIPAATRSAIETKLEDLEQKSGIQLVVATVASLQGSDVEAFANQLFRYWRLGDVKNNNGALLLVAPNERKVRIEVGYGLEGTLTDALSNVIITSAIVPRFKVGDYAGGVERGVDGIMTVLATDAPEWTPKPQVRQDDRQSPFDQLMPLLVLLVFILRFRLMARHARTAPGGWVRGGPMIFIPGGISWGGRSSGPAWGNGGSGGFSGGGGSSGGGGASGSW
jgi:uncharacterized protein